MATPLNAVGSSITGRVSKIRPQMTATATPIRPRSPQLPAIDRDLAGDTVFRGQRNEAHRALSDYQARMANSQNTNRTNYTRDVINTKRDRGFAREDQGDDYASRGMSHSGLRVRASSDLNTDFDNKLGGLSDKRAQFLTDLTQGFNEFRSTQRVNDTRFRNEAINRRATHVGEGL